MNNIKEVAEVFNDYFVKVGSTLANVTAEPINKVSKKTALIKTFTPCFSVEFTKMKALILLMNSGAKIILTKIPLICH